MRLVKTTVIIWTREYSGELSETVASAVEGLRAALDEQDIERVVYTLEPRVVPDAEKDPDCYDTVRELLDPEFAP